jgi:hypothetical protein
MALRNDDVASVSRPPSSAGSVASTTIGVRTFFFTTRDAAAPRRSRSGDGGSSRPNERRAAALRRPLRAGKRAHRRASGSKRSRDRAHNPRLAPTGQRPGIRSFCRPATRLYRAGLVAYTTGGCGHRLHLADSPCSPQVSQARKARVTAWPSPAVGIARAPACEMKGDAPSRRGVPLRWSCMVR